MVFRDPIFLAFVLFATIAMALTPIQESLGEIYAIGVQGVEGMGANPASITGNSNHQISANATRYWLGLEDESPFTSKIAYSSPSARWGAYGAELKYFSASVQNRFDLTISYAYAFEFKNRGEVSFGLSGRWIRNQYSPTDFYRFEDDPLFNEFGYSASGLGLDLGAVYRKNRIAFGFCAKNVVQPSLSISNDMGEGYREALVYSTAASYAVKNWLIPRIQFSQNSEGKLELSAGTEILLFNGLVALRTGYSVEGFALGFGLLGRSKLPVNFDYAMLYPTGSLSKARLTNHSVGLTFNIPQSKKNKKINETGPPSFEFPDIIAAKDPHSKDMPILEIGNKGHFSAIIGNVGGKPSDNTFASVFIINTDSSMVGSPFAIPPLDPSEIYDIDWTWEPKAAGVYKFIVSADDDGSRFPLRNSKISEVDVSNNRIEIPFYVIGPIFAEVKVENEAITIPQLTYIADEEPLVPVVFFEKNSLELADRFMPTLEVIARRIAENPDIKLVLRGYTDSESETGDTSSLYFQRAKAVKNEIGKKTSSDVEVMIESVDNYNPETPRIRPLTSNTSIEDKVWAQQENRRVEMSTIVNGFETDLLYTDLSTFDVSLSQYKDSLLSISILIKRVLDENPGASLIFEADVQTGAQWQSAYDNLSELREAVIGSIQADINFQIVPVFIKLAEDFKPVVRVYLSGEGMLYRPKEAALAAKDFEIPKDKRENRISISIGEGIVDSFTISIVDQQMNTIRVLSSGSNSPPKIVVWDWRDKNGNLVDPRKIYRVELSLQDPAENIWNNYSSEISIEISDKEIRRESTIIVQFAFDEVTSTSKFLESRIESMARKIIDLSNKENSYFNVKIIGHTDPIGSDRRNMILSQERAEEEESAIRRYLRNMLDIDNDSGLEKWLADHRITLVRQGFSDGKPYEVERYRDGRFERVLLGNNVFPEGRASNRRVIIQIEEIRE
ncbi:type IX secretion system membrane protein PorP/SprF [bacterium]|nr:type IX secretion system membrane protein PorP/SprF [bacterium]